MGQLHWVGASRTDAMESFESILSELIGAHFYNGNINITWVQLDNVSKHQCYQRLKGNKRACTKRFLNSLRTAAPPNTG